MRRIDTLAEVVTAAARPRRPISRRSDSKLSSRRHESPAPGLPAGSPEHLCQGTSVTWRHSRPPFFLGRPRREELPSRGSDTLGHRFRGHQDSSSK